MVMYYVFKFLNERRERIENAELEEKRVIQELANTDIENLD